MLLPGTKHRVDIKAVVHVLKIVVMKKQAISLLFFILLQFVVGQNSSCTLNNYNRYDGEGRRCKVICSNSVEIITCLYKDCIELPFTISPNHGIPYNVTCDAEYVRKSYYAILNRRLPNIRGPSYCNITNSTTSDNRYLYVITCQEKRCKQRQYTSSTGETCYVSCVGRFEVIKCFNSIMCMTGNFSYNGQVECTGQCEGGIESFTCPQLEDCQKYCLWNHDMREKREIRKARDVFGFPHCQQRAIYVEPSRAGDKYKHEE